MSAYNYVRSGPNFTNFFLFSAHMTSNRRCSVYSANVYMQLQFWKKSRRMSSSYVRIATFSQQNIDLHVSKICPMPRLQTVIVLCEIFPRVAGRLWSGAPGLGSDDRAWYKQVSRAIHEETQRYRDAHFRPTLPLQRNRHPPSPRHHQRSQIPVFTKFKEFNGFSWEI